MSRIYMTMIMMNYFSRIVDRWKAFSLISSRDHCQRSSPSRISDTTQAGFEPAQNLSSGFAEWSCTVVIITTTRRNCMNSENCKTYGPHRIRLNLTDKVNLRRGDNCMTLSHLSICYTWKNIKKQCKNNKFRISRRTWDQEFELPNGCYDIWDIQYYFEYIFKKHETITDNPPCERYVSKIQNWVTFKIRFGYYLQLLTADIMKLLGNAEEKITKNKNDENVPHLENIEVVLVHQWMIFTQKHFVQSFHTLNYWSKF